MTMTKPLLAALSGKAQAKVPFWLMRQAGRYLPEYRKIRARKQNFLELCFTPELAAEVTLQPLRRFAMDAAILFSDILVVPYALGQSVAFREGEGPVLEPINTPTGVAKLDPERVLERLAPVFETVARVRDGLDDRTALIGFAGAPWTVAAYMVEGGTSRDFAAVKGWALAAPAEFSKLIDILVEASAAYLIAQIDAGAEVVQIFDTWAGVLSEPELRKWVIGPTAAIRARLKARYPTVPVIGFPRGIGVLYPDYVRETGVDAVGLDTAMPVAWAAKEVQNLCAVQGNLDPQILVVGGKALHAEVDRILDALGPGPFVFNLGHGIVPETPPSHVGDLARWVRDWRR